MLPVSSGHNLLPITHFSVSEKIVNFLALSSERSESERVLPNRQTVQNALDVNRFAENQLLSTDAVLGLAGEVQLVTYGNEKPRNKYLEITFEPDGQLNVTRYAKENDHWQITWDENIRFLKEIKVAIMKFGREIYPWATTSASSESVNILKVLGGLQAVLSKSTGTEYRLLKSDVFQTAELKFASI